MITTILNTEIGEVEIPAKYHSKYITTPEFNKLTEEYVVARLKQADLVRKTDFNYKITSFNKRITSNKRK